MKKYTIKNIAELAGVSKGTVDRVIHKRGKVSTKALEKVNAILNDIDYKPNLLARSLKKTQQYHICVVLPNYKIDPFWIPCYEGIQEAIEEYSSFGIFIEYYFFDVMNATSFLEVNKKVLVLQPNAVLIAPLFYKETVKVVAEYSKANILVSKFNNQLDIENTQNFVGQDLFKSGRIAASLMKEIIFKNATIAIINIDEDANNAIYVQEKERGFRNYYSKFNSYTIITKNCDKHSIYNELNSLVYENPNLAGIFVTTSKVYKVAAVLKDKNINHIKLIGYDLLSENIDYLNQNIINFLIHQNPKKQVYLGLTYLVEHFIFDKEIPAKSLLPIDIITAENLETYLESS